MSRRPSPSTPPRALMATLLLCLTALLLGYVINPALFQNPARAVEAVPTATADPTLSFAVTPAPTGEPDHATGGEVPEDPAGIDPFSPSDPSSSATAISVDYDYSRSVPRGEEADPETWFQDAVFIGDSRTDGLHLYSGVKGGTYLVHTGMTVFDVVNQAAVLGSGENKYSVLSALSGKQYGKIYVALGVNELGVNSDHYAEAFDQMVDDLRASQPDAVLYVQAIIPVCPQVCKAQGTAYYINNENIALFNDILTGLCAEKKVFFLNVSEALVDPDTWELPADMTFDGVHLKRDGYKLWLNYLLCHTGEGEPEEVLTPVQESPVPTPSKDPSTVVNHTPAPTPSEEPSAPAVTPSEYLPAAVEETPAPTPSEESAPEIPIPAFTPTDGMPPAAPEATPEDTGEAP